MTKIMTILKIISQTKTHVEDSTTQVKRESWVSSNSQLITLRIGLPNHLSLATSGAGYLTPGQAVKVQIWKHDKTPPLTLTHIMNIPSVHWFDTCTPFYTSLITVRTNLHRTEVDIIILCTGWKHISMIGIHIKDSCFIQMFFFPAHIPTGEMETTTLQS